MIINCKFATVLIADMSAMSMVTSTVVRISTSTFARNSSLYKEGASEFSLSVPEMPPPCRERSFLQLLVAEILTTILVTIFITVLFADMSAISMVTRMVMSAVANLQCNYLSQTKTCGQRWQEISMGVILHRKWVIWNGQSIPFYPSGAK